MSYASPLSRRAFLAASSATAAASLLPVTAQESPITAATSTLVITSNFAQGSDGWLPVFTDYNLVVSGFEFLAEVRTLPAYVEVPRPFRQAYYLQSHNRSDDVFMFLKKVLTHEDGIVENTAYRLSFDIWLASNAGDCPGAGGDAGTSVYLKAGGSTQEPVPLLMPNGYLSVTIDKGNQSEGGREMGVVGNISNGGSCEEPRYVLLRKSYQHPDPIRSSASGDLWIAVGTDSGYEGLTGLYYYQVRVRLRRVSSTAQEQ
ncbi:MAG: hypothetical protein JO185_10855 [Acidobacteriaceae bacterium]|nr:hypothetical protein [Acidobacteriaceae bacterium]MBV9676824.1 hypothetical protein [Acidobacteriaceae bacterium]